MDFHLSSYSKHKNQVHDTKLVDTWKRFDTVDYWRHQRMYENILPLLQTNPGASWLTVGDGRYGTDANFLIRHGADATASDINNSLLKKAMADGFITKFSTENAESLSFEDSSFDFVLCKESYHHFPRPFLALYEMLRVCRKCVVLIEPKDNEIINPYRQGFLSNWFWTCQSIKNILKQVVERKKYIPEPRYEESGNYVYSISQREMEKVALGMNLPLLAFKSMNDFYLKGVENELIENNGPLFTTLKAKLKEADTVSNKREEQYGLLITLLFKTEPSHISKMKMTEHGFSFQVISGNPYINKTR